MNGSEVGPVECLACGGQAVVLPGELVDRLPLPDAAAMLTYGRKGKHVGSVFLAGLVFATSQDLLGLLAASAVSAGVLVVLELAWEAYARRRTSARLAAIISRRQLLRVCVECGAIHEPGGGGSGVVAPLDLQVDVLLEEGKKVEAVKAVLDARGAGLKDAMDRVKSRERE